MTLTLDPKLEAALAENARQRGVAPEELALDVLRRKFIPMEPQDDWEREVFSIGAETGVSLPDSALSREELYDK